MTAFALQHERMAVDARAREVAGNKASNEKDRKYFESEAARLVSKPAPSPDVLSVVAAVYCHASTLLPVVELHAL